MAKRKDWNAALVSRADAQARALFRAVRGSCRDPGHRRRCARQAAEGRAGHGRPDQGDFGPRARSEEHTSELQSLMRISYAVFCLKKKKNTNDTNRTTRV